MLISVLSAPTDLNLNAPAWKMAPSNDQNAKISNWVSMCIFNELWCWFSKASKVLS